MKRAISLMCAMAILFSLAIVPVGAGTITPWDDYDDDFGMILYPALRADDSGGFSWTSGNFSRRFSGDIKLGYYDSTVTNTDTVRGCWVSCNKDTSATVTNQWISEDGKTVTFDYTAELDLMPNEILATTYHAVFVMFFKTVSDTSNYTKFSGGVDGYEFIRHVPAGTVRGEEQMESGRITYTLPDNFDSDVHLVGYAIWCVEDAPFVPRDDDYHYGNTYLSPTIYSTPVNMFDMSLCEVGEPPEDPDDTENFFTCTVADGEVTVTGIANDVAGNIVIPSHIEGYPVTTIGKDAFKSVVGITGVTLPDTVTTIEDGAMDDLPLLKNIHIPANVTTIEGNIFVGCSALEEITVSPENEHFKAVDGALLTKDGKGFVTYPIGKGTTEYTVPDGVETIRSNAFYGCASITDIKIPDTVTFIGANAFDGTGVYDDESNREGGIFYIGNYLIEAVSTTGTGYTVKDGTTVIGESALAGCSKLKKITIPDSVTNINSRAFDSCTALSEVFFGGSEDEWANITVGENNDELLTAGRIHYNVDDAKNHYTRIVTKEPTCTATGLAEYVCPCGYKNDFEVISSMGHSNVAKPGKDATCTESGWTSYKKCMTCGLITGYNTIDAWGHSLIEHSAKSPTCTEIGWFAYEECEDCDYTTYIELRAQGHEYENGTCTYCGEAEPALPGDVNGNGAVDTTDLAVFRRYMSGATISDFNYAAADVNGDGEIKFSDASTLARVISGAIV